MKMYLLPLALGALAILGVPGLAGPEAVLDSRAGAAARRILDRSGKVVIAGFRVVFRPGVAEDPPMLLAGVATDDFQRITEEAYVDFKDQLARSGVTVLDPGAFKAVHDHGKPGFASATNASSLITDGDVASGSRIAVFSPAELPLFPGHFDDRGIAGEAVNPAGWRALNRLSIETKAVVLVPTIVVEFIRSGAGAQINLAARQSNVAVFHARIRLAGDLGSLHLRDDLEVPGYFGTLERIPAADPRQVLAADPAQFSQLSLQGVKRFNRAVSAFIAAP